MKEIPFLVSTPVYIEIRQGVLKALQGERGLEIPLDRAETGRLSDSCRDKVIQSLQEFLNRKAWQPRPRALCAIGAGGVSLRRVTLPPAAREEMHRLLLLQVENEFPLPPDDLAWGWRRLDVQATNGGAPQEILIAAVRKEVVEDYASVLTSAGLHPVFTLASFARSELCPPKTGSWAVLDIGRTQSELITLDGPCPAAVRVLPWGIENILKTGAGLDSLAAALRSNWAGGKLVTTGDADGAKSLAGQLGVRLGPAIECRHLEVEPGPGRSAAVVALKKAVDEGRGASLIFQVKARHANGGFRLSQPAPKELLKAAAILLASLLILPYAEALLLKPFLSKKLSSLQSSQGRLAVIDRELDFLQFIKQNQLPYLDALYLFAKFAPPGARVDSLSMNRRGEVSLRGSMQNAQQVVEFRSRLIESRFFSSVAVEEQAPTPDRQRVNVRLSAQWKPAEERAALAVGPTSEEIEKAKTGSKQPTPGAVQPRGGPAPAPPVPASPPQPHPVKL